MEAALARVHDPEDKAFGDIQWIAIALSESGEGQRHLGVLYRHETMQGGIALLHLAWHHWLLFGAPERECVWIEPELDPELRRVLSRLCNKVAGKYVGKRRTIKYALRYGDGRFDPKSGEFLTEEGIGLTCATFVLALFASYGVSLVRGEEWLTERDEERKAGDEAWGRDVVSKLRGYLASRRDPEDIAELEAHIAVVEADEVGCARFRPEEVAAAGTTPEPPAGFAYAEPVGRDIVEKLRRR